MKTISHAAVATALLVTLARAASAETASGAMSGGGMASHGKMAAGEAMEMPMAEHHRAMMARMDSLDAVLTTKLEAVGEAATETRKLQALEAVVAELITQRRAMHEHMPQMMGKMIGHMMQHMGDGMMDGGMMSGCPMMKARTQDETGGMDAQSGGDHESHH